MKSVFETDKVFPIYLKVYYVSNIVPKNVFYSKFYDIWTEINKYFMSIALINAKALSEF